MTPRPPAMSEHPYRPLVVPVAIVRVETPTEKRRRLEENWWRACAMQASPEAAAAQRAAWDALVETFR